MKAAVVTAFGEPDVFELAELPDPVPGPGQVSIDVSHAAVGLIDVHLRQGLYKDVPGLPQPPYVPGLEVAGTIRALGAGTEGFRVGEPVVTLSGTGGEGGYNSVAVVDAAMTVSLDGDVDPALAVAAVPNATTAYLALTEAAHLKGGERVLVLGALGGLASAFPGVARSLGASRVVGTARQGSLAKARESTLPYDEIIANEELPNAIGTDQFDVVIDAVGGQARTDALELLAPMGRMVLVGNASDDWGHTIPSNTLWHRNLAVMGFSAGSYCPAHPDKSQAAAKAVLEPVRQGLLAMRLEELPLADAAEAHRRLESGSVGGRIVLVP